MDVAAVAIESAAARQTGVDELTADGRAVERPLPRFVSPSLLLPVLNSLVQASSSQVIRQMTCLPALLRNTAALAGIGQTLPYAVVQAHIPVAVQAAALRILAGALQQMTSAEATSFVQSLSPTATEPIRLFMDYLKDTLFDWRTQIEPQRASLAQPVRNGNERALIASGLAHCIAALLKGIKSQESAEAAASALEEFYQPESAADILSAMASCPDGAFSSLERSYEGIEVVRGTIAVLELAGGSMSNLAITPGASVTIRSSVEEAVVTKVGPGLVVVVQNGRRRTVKPDEVGCGSPTKCSPLPPTAVVVRPQLMLGCGNSIDKTISLTDR